VTSPDLWAPPPWDQEPARAGQRQRRRRSATALGVVALLLLGSVGAGRVAEDRREERVRAQVTALLPGLTAFVERERGLPFLEEVDVEVLGDRAFLAALREDDEDEGEQQQEEGDPEATLRALGLLEPGTDLDGRVEEVLDAGVAGFYDPTTGRLVVRGRQVTPFVELVVVHELVHALQDQHFDIDRPELDEADDERSTAFTALVEGDAVRVETAWYRAQSAERRAAVDAVTGEGVDASDDVVTALLGFPYYAGPPYAAALLERGGQEALDTAFVDPPTTTAEVLLPGLGRPAGRAPAPAPEGDVVDEGVLGVLGLALVVGADPAELDPALRGWRADRYVTVEDDGTACTTAHVAADDVPALRRLLADAGLDVGDGPEGTVRLRSCAARD
jgi:hypothetical protein